MFGGPSLSITPYLQSHLPQANKRSVHRIYKQLKNLSVESCFRSKSKDLLVVAVSCRWIDSMPSEKRKNMRRNTALNRPECFG